MFYVPKYPGYPIIGMILTILAGNTQAPSSHAEDIDENFLTIHPVHLQNLHSVLFLDDKCFSSLSGSISK